MGKYSKDDIQKAIIREYGSQKALADLMETSPDALSNRIKRASNKFVKELEVKYGVIVEPTNNEDGNDKDKVIAILLKRIEQLENENTELRERGVKTDSLPQATKRKVNKH